MIIKEVVLPSEKERISEFLEGLGLKYEQNIDRTIYVEENGEIAATVSASGYILKCLAVNPDCRNENYAAVLVGEMIKILHAAGYYHYHVFTKSEYRDVFTGLGFTPLVVSDKVAVLEGGEGGIDDAINKMRVQMKFSLGLENVGEDDIACVVLNGNPFTDGHLKLVEYAAAEHKHALVFVLEEDGSYFTFRERYAMAYLALKPYENVLVLPSSRYIVSKATFPGYFLKSADEVASEYARYDAMIFAQYFIPRLGIVKRYVGSETTDYMKIYNRMLGEALKDKLEVVPRFEADGGVISAAKVRSLIESGKVDEALSYVPRSIHAVLKGMILNRNV